MTHTPLTPEALAELERALADLSPPIGAVASDLNGYDLEQMSLPMLNDVAAILNAAPALIAAARRLGEVDQQLAAANARVAELEARNLALATAAERKVARFAKHIVDHALPQFARTEPEKDHACAQCVPNGDIVIAGFVCVYHEAAALAAAKLGE